MTTALGNSFLSREVCFAVVAFLGFTLVLLNGSSQSKSMLVELACLPLIRGGSLGETSGFLTAQVFRQTFLLYFQTLQVELPHHLSGSSEAFVLDWILSSRAMRTGSALCSNCPTFLADAPRTLKACRQALTAGSCTGFGFSAAAGATPSNAAAVSAFFAVRLICLCFLSSWVLVRPLSLQYQCSFKFRMFRL